MRRTQPLVRCSWAAHESMHEYHDREWGTPVHDDRVHFEFIVLEGAQAGLSWQTILGKRDRYRRVLDGFDPARVARYDKRKLASLLKDPGIVRNRLKVESLVKNARAFLAVQEEFGSYDAYVWRFVEGRPLVNRREELRDIPARTQESDALSKDLQRRGFTFVGGTICYAYMQAVGLVNDHLVRCFRFAPLARAGA
ncbi:MAG TPA: DNA-3-methyladenine glycosylase I [Gemmatimonadaceae bacterium]|nr:DNA-3-methyladenine glycosylase I [Gemmatimonadaceae bacterium]